MPRGGAGGGWCVVDLRPGQMPKPWPTPHLPRAPPHTAHGRPEVAAHLNLTSQNAESPQRPQPRAHTPLTSADALTAQQPKRRSLASAWQPRVEAVPCAMHTCSSRRETQPHSMPNSQSAAASHQHSSLKSSAVPCAMHTCSSRTRTDATTHTTMQMLCIQWSPTTDPDSPAS